MSKVRILYNMDGSVQVVHHAPKSPLSWEDSMAKSTPEGLEYDDVEASEVPQTRDKRYAWRGSKGNGIHIDNTVEKGKSKLEKLEDRIKKLETNE